MKQSKATSRMILSAILINGVAVVLMTTFGNTGEKGVFTFSNIFFITIILTFLVFAVRSTRYSLGLLRDFKNEKRPGAAAGQLGITAFSLCIYGAVIWGFVQAILRNIR